MKRFPGLLLLASILILGVAGIADAVTPSGPGQTTAAHSVSVVMASDATMPSTTVAGIDLLKQPTRSVAVTKSDATDLTATCTKGLWVGTTGDLSVKLAGDSTATTWKNVPNGTYIPGAYSRVMAATAAADIVCLYGP